MNDFTRANIMKWINRLHVKSAHERYMNDEMNYQEYMWYINTTINTIRDVYFITRYNRNQLNLIWQNLNLAGTEWRRVREHLFSAIAS